MLHPRFEALYADLVAAWRRHHDLRRERAPLPELAESRRRLDRLRDDIWRLRLALSPEPREIREMAFSAWCSTLGETVWIRWSDTEGDRYRCVCGETVARPVTG